MPVFRGHYLLGTFPRTLAVTLVHASRHPIQNLPELFPEEASCGRQNVYSIGLGILGEGNTVFEHALMQCLESRSAGKDLPGK